MSHPSDPFKHEFEDPHQRFRQTKRPQGKLPEFIIIEDDDTTKSGPESTGHFNIYEKLNVIQKKQSPFILRLFCFALAIVTFIWTIGTLMLMTIFTIAYCLTLGLSKTLGKYVKDAYRNLKKALAISTGLSIAIFSPALGFGLIFLYLYLNGQPNSSLFANFLFKDKYH